MVDCPLLGDVSVVALATYLPKLRRIGLVKVRCACIVCVDNLGHQRYQHCYPIARAAVGYVGKSSLVLLREDYGSCCGVPSEPAAASYTLECHWYSGFPHTRTTAVLSHGTGGKSGLQTNPLTPRASIHGSEPHSAFTLAMGS